jgi:ATP-binding cassette subfamily C protein
VRVPRRVRARAGVVFVRGGRPPRARRRDARGPARRVRRHRRHDRRRQEHARRPIVGLLAPTTGRITIDGTDVRSCLPAWQRRIGYVPQAIFLLDGTIRRNIALGVPPAEIDELRLARAVRQAQLDPLLATLPDGLDTTIGERGVRLSGGERQRVGIARALYHDPAVLVLDEATSALDSRTEADLGRAIEALRGETTLIVVAHRLASVRRCDRLVLLRDGRVADSGSFEDLVARNPDFREMASAASVS